MEGGEAGSRAASDCLRTPLCKIRTACHFEMSTGNAKQSAGPERDCGAWYVMAAMDGTRALALRY